MASVEDDLQTLDLKIKQLKLDYERYFLGTRPREPVMLRGEVQKLFSYYSNVSIKNTALRFKFNSLASRFQAFKRQWNETQRQIEQGTYTRHRFKAKLHDREKVERPAQSGMKRGDSELYDAYLSAREACGQGTAGMTPAKLKKVLAQQEKQLRKRFGDTDFRFRVVVENGKAKVKASRARE